MWYLKIPAKMILARLPVDYALFRRIGVFRHGAMDSAEYAISVFRAHLERARARGLPSAFNALEFGPGDSVASALLARSIGARSTYLVDVGPFASRDLHLYRSVARYAESTGISLPTDLNFSDFDALLASCGARYLTNGLASLREIPGGSIDFAWSQAVLEHVRLGDFRTVLAELRRVMRPHGLCSHRIDLRDHISGGLNNLRFPERIWETDLMASSGFYTNRIGFRQMLAIFAEAGFASEVIRVDKWERLPIRPAAIQRQFRESRGEDLLVSGFDVVLRPLSQPSA
jgi:SAM-dependent methyltransferase